MPIKLVPLLAWLTLLLTSVGCSGLSKVDVARVLTSGRDGWQHPEKVIAALAIQPGESVAEVGAGGGYWIPRLSEAVGPQGRVYAVEVEQGLVDELEELVDDRGLTNVTVILGAYDDPRLPEAAIDLVMTCLTYHHIDERPAYFRQLRRALSPRGRVAHLDDRPDAGPPISWFQSDGHWIDPERVVSEMSEAGYARTGEYDFLQAQSFQVFTPAPPAAASSTGGFSARITAEEEQGR